MTAFHLPGRKARFILFAMIILTFSIVGSVPVFADSISYTIDFTKAFGPTVSDGSFTFSSPIHAKGVIADANFVDLEAYVGHVLYTASSPADDFARINKHGILKGLFADLEPNGPVGDVLQLYAGSQHRYIIWDNDMDRVLGRGTYDVDLGKTPVPEPSFLSLLTLSFGLFGGATFLMRSRRGINAVPAR